MSPRPLGWRGVSRSPYSNSGIRRCVYSRLFGRSRVPAPPLLGDFGAPSSLMSRKWPFESRLAVPQVEVTAAFFHAKGACLDLSSLSTRLTTICLSLSLEPYRSMKGHRGRGSRGYRGLPWRAITDGSFHGRLSCATCVCFASSTPPSHDSCLLFLSLEGSGIK